LIGHVITTAAEVMCEARGNTSWFESQRRVGADVTSEERTPWGSWA